MGLVWVWDDGRFVYRSVDFGFWRLISLDLSGVEVSHV